MCDMNEPLSSLDHTCRLSFYLEQELYSATQIGVLHNTLVARNPHNSANFGVSVTAEAQPMRSCSQNHGTVQQRDGASRHSTGEAHLS